MESEIKHVSSDNRARRLKGKWSFYVNEQLKNQKSYRNFGRMDFLEYARYQYKKYCQLAECCGEKPLKFLEWLN